MWLCATPITSWPARFALPEIGRPVRAFDQIDPRGGPVNAIVSQSSLYFDRLPAGLFRYHLISTINLLAHDPL
jgi:hypothetical protein